MLKKREGLCLASMRPPSEEGGEQDQDLRLEQGLQASMRPPSEEGGETNIADLIAKLHP